MRRRLLTLTLLALAAVPVATDAGLALAGLGQRERSAPPRRGEAPQPGTRPEGERGARGRDRGRDADEPERAAPDATQTAERYFALADGDGDGWLTFREAQRALLVDRAGFFRFDTDRDGLVTPAEFTARYLAVIRLGGTFRPPLATGDGSRPSAVDPLAALEAHDTNFDRALDATEVAALLADAGVEDVDAQDVLTRVDADHSGRLELDEVLRLLRLLPTTEPEPEEAPSPEETAESILELFGRAEPVADDRPSAAPPLPPTIPGPLPVFHRLDLDRDGGITIADLEALQRPLRTPVRIATVLAYLDTDGDGSLSPRELRASMSDAPLRGAGDE